MWRALLVLPVALLIGAAVSAQTRVEAFHEGTAYRALPVPTLDASAPLTVQELFSYACVHCHALQPALNGWAQALPGDVRVDRVPAVFNSAWKLLARAYYVAEVCNVLTRTHGAMFAAIHEEGRVFRDAEAIAGFYAEQAEGQRGARCRSPEDFLRVFDSLEVAQRLQQALALSRVWQMEALPTLVVAGTWRTDAGLAGSPEAMFDVAEHLLRRARAEIVANDATRAH